MLHVFRYHFAGRQKPCSFGMHLRRSVLLVYEFNLTCGGNMEIVSSAEFSISYDGELVRAGFMDVQELAPALLASGTLIQKANWLLNGESTNVEVKVRSDFRRGSFLVNLHIDQGLLEQAKHFLLAHPGIKDAQEILKTLFFYGGIPASMIGGLFKLIKWLGNKTPDRVVIENNSGTVILSLGDQSFRTSNKTYELFEDPAARRAASTLVAPVSREGIESLEIRGGDDVETVTKEEAPLFEYSQYEGEMLLDSVREAWLSIIALSFKKEHKWKFSGGINATIEDQEFWGRVHRHEERFEEEDQLRVMLRTATTRDDKGMLHNFHVIEKVLEHHHAPKQSTFENL